MHKWYRYQRSSPAINMIHRSFRYGWGSKGQSSRSGSCKTYFRWSSGPREFALYRVTKWCLCLCICRTSQWLNLIPGLQRLKSHKPLWRDLETLLLMSQAGGGTTGSRYGGQFQVNGRRHNPTLWFRPSPASVVTAESFSNGSGPLQCVPQEMRFHWQRTLWQDSVKRNSDGTLTISVFLISVQYRLYENYS